MLQNRGIVPRRVRRRRYFRTATIRPTRPLRDGWISRQWWSDSLRRRRGGS